MMIEVRWIDARSEEGWTEESELDHRLAEITTIGHLVREADGVLCVASSRDKHTEQLSGIVYIPLVCVIARRMIDDCLHPV